MFALLDRLRRRCLLCAPTDKELELYLASFSAGFKRGAEDVRANVSGVEWTSTVATISSQMVEDHSAVEAGSWYAGVRAGRKAATAGSQHDAGIVNKLFCQDWESERIARLALECAPNQTGLRKLLKPRCWNEKAALIKDRLY